MNFRNFTMSSSPPSITFNHIFFSSLTPFQIYLHSFYQVSLIPCNRLLHLKNSIQTHTHTSMPLQSASFVLATITSNHSTLIYISPVLDHPLSLGDLQFKNKRQTNFSQSGTLVSGLKCRKEHPGSKTWIKLIRKRNRFCLDTPEGMSTRNTQSVRNIVQMNLI